MKEYYGKPPFTEEPSDNKVVSRNNGRNPQAIPFHRIESDEKFDWGKDNPGATDLSRSLVFDIFAVPECPSSPGICECLDANWTDKLKTFTGFKPQEIYDSVKQKFILKQQQGEPFKLGQAELCDYIFDTISFLRIESEVGAINLPEIELVDAKL